MRARSLRRLPSAFAPLLLLAAGGCTLVDQRTFAPAPLPPDAAALATPALPAAPTLTLRPDDAASGWQATLAAAVAAHPAGRFAVMAPVVALPNPLSHKPTPDNLAGTQRVAAALRGDGVAASRITLGYVGTPVAAPSEVWLYLR